MLRRKMLLVLFSAVLCSLSPVSGVADSISENQPQPVTIEGVLGAGGAGTFLLCEKPDTFFPDKKTCGHLANRRFIQGNVSDSITFSPGPRAGTISVEFCSDNGPKDNDDKFCGAKPKTTGAYGLQEMGTEYRIELTPYDPVSGQPGYATRSSATIQYKLTSDTPEPSASLLFGSALLALCWMVRGKRRAWAGE